MPSTKNKLLYAEATEGYVIKILIDTLSTAMSRTSFRVSKTGFFHRDNDENSQILFDVGFPHGKWRKFVCKKNMWFSINLKHAQKMIRNVKKKDAVILYIERNRKTGKPDNKLWVVIRPSTGTNPRSETVSITITHLEIFPSIHELPEIFDDGESGPVKVYGFPIVVAAQDFQKFKKMTNVGKTAVVEMQKNNYISFYSDCGELYSSKLEYGEVVEDTLEESEESVSASEEPSGSEESVSASSEASGSEDIPVEKMKEWYREDFNMKLFSTLLKLPGLCSQMGFYAPQVERFPLKVNVEAGHLGDVTVYIKDMKQIAYENSLNTDKKDK